MNPCRIRRAAPLALLAALLLVSPAAAAEEKAGTTVFQFLKLGVGARAMGMGGAFTAVSDDADAMYWNPAGLSLIRLPEGTTNYLSYLPGVNAGGLSYAKPVSKTSAFGMAVRYLRVGGLQTTTSERRTGEGLPEFSANDLSISAGMSGRLRGNLYGGATVSFLYEGITALDGFATTAGAIDLGLLFRATESIAAGFALRNFGGQFSLYRAEKEDLPLVAAIGVSAKLFSNRLLLALDGDRPADNAFGVNAGAEFELVRDFFARGGYRSRDARIGDEAADGGDLAGWTFGVGMAGARRYRVDYAYTSFADLGDAHRVSLALIFRP